MASDLKGKVVLITGASTGIGAAAARAFARLGSRLLVHYNASKEAAELVARDIKAVGGEAHLVGGDFLIRDLPGVHRLQKRQRRRGPREQVVLRAAAQCRRQLRIPSQYRIRDLRALPISCLFNHSVRRPVIYNFQWQSHQM